MQYSPLFLFATALGNPSVIVSVLTAFFLIVLIVHRRHVIASFAGALVLGGLIAFLAKEFIHSPRPSSNMLLYASGNSFPSAHALIATIVYGFIGFYLWHYIRTPLSRALGLIIGVGIPYFVGISRVYLGVHWVSDVVGGWVIGVGVLFAWIFHLMRAEKREVYEPHLSKRSHLFLFLIITVETILIFVLAYGFESSIILHTGV